MSVIPQASNPGGKPVDSGLLAPPDFSLERAVKEIGPWDLSLYKEITSTELSEAQIKRIRTPDRIFPRQREVLAVHWHPEWIPMEHIAARIAAMFPNRETEIIIPTQHNQILTWGDYAGVEVDCYSGGFGRKVQLLVHLQAQAVEEAHVFRSMLEHTFKYRHGQLFEFMDSILEPQYAHRLEEAVHETGANPDLVNLTRFYTARLRQMLYDLENQTPEVMIKNKLLAEYLDAQRSRHPDVTINRALLLLAAVKAVVKREFSLEYFYKASEVIEEAHSLGARVVIPHPEQFWPILLADYKVDGWEVWNPQSREYTDFLITALNNYNKRLAPGYDPLLVFMGDDCHLSTKARDPQWVEKAKLMREVGLQPAWEELPVRKVLSLAGIHRAHVIEAYKERLA